MTKVTASAETLKEPAVDMRMWIGSESTKVEIACLQAYLPDGVPPEVKASLEREFRRILSDLTEKMSASWR